MIIFFNNKPDGISVRKMLRLSGAAALMICFVVTSAFNVFAEAVNEIKLDVNGGEAALELYFPQAAAEETASMQISVSVNSSSDKVNAEFIPDSGLSAKIVESRYKNGVLNIYLAGTEPLFPADGRLTAGIVKISGDTSASVGIVKDSVKFVRGGELVSPDGEIDYPASVSIANGPSSSGQPPSVTSRPSGNEFPIYSDNSASSFNDREPSAEESDIPVWQDDTLNDDDDEPYVTDSRSEIYEQDTVGDNFNPPDTSALQDALSRADGYKENDYTESSYDALNDAVNKANALISDPNATQDEIDEALLDIENAIGMLTMRNDIPSGAEGYGENKASDAGGGNGISADGSVENGEASMFGQDDGQSYGSSGTQQGSRDDSGQDIQDENADNVLDGAVMTDNSLSAENGVSGLAVCFILFAVIAAAVIVMIVIKKPKRS